jgi:type I restriction enzyme S subunit
MGKPPQGQLADIAEIVMGQSPEGEACNTVGNGMPLLNGPTEFGGHHPTPVQYTSDARKLAAKGDILFCVRGSTTGKMNWADRPYAIGRGLAAIRPKHGLDTAHYVRAVIEAGLSQLLQAATGSTFPNVSREQLLGMPCHVLSLPEQKRIAGILGALDDKIELNRKMNETLEQMAKTLFKSWFVDFDPVHAKAAGRQPVGMDKATADLFPDSFVDSELGNVPKGWRVGTLDELVELRTERIAATPAKDGMRYLALEDMPSRSLDVSQFQPGSAVNSSIIKFLEGDILLGAMRPYFHKVGLAFFDGITRSTTMVLTPKKCFLRHFALLHVFSDELIRYATTASIGTTMPYVKWDSLAKYQIIIPTQELLARFDEQAGRLVIMIGNNGNESRLLAEMRDLLIPQLLSGECNA